MCIRDSIRIVFNLEVLVIVRAAWHQRTAHSVSYTHLGMYTAGTEGSLGDLLYHLVMPAFVVAFTLLGDLVKQTRGGLLEVLNEDYVKKMCIRDSLLPASAHGPVRCYDESNQ